MDALIRETIEEAGLVIIKDTIKEYGYVHRIQKSNSDDNECFIQDNFYYLCDVEDTQLKQNLDNYEKNDGYCLEFVDPILAIKKNRNIMNNPYDNMMFEREAKVLELLIHENKI